MHARCCRGDPEQVRQAWSRVWCKQFKEEYRVAFNYEFIEDAQTPCTEGFGNEEKIVALVILLQPVANSQSGGSAI